MWGNVLTEAFSLKGLAEQNPKWGSGKSEKACGHANSLTLSGLPNKQLRRIKK